MPHIMNRTLTVMAVFACVVAGGGGVRANDSDGACGPRYVAGEEADLPRIEFAADVVSINDRCPVRRVKLNLRMPPVWVNAQAVAFC